jgi:DNA-directed RNA polymerase specialized sigma24 family protein
MLPPTSSRLRAATDAGANVRDLLQKGDVPTAARAALTAHGAELFGFLIGVLDDTAAARILYAKVGERVVGELGAFRWRCPLRTWLYAVARRALRDHRQPAAREGERGATGASYSAVSVSRCRARAPRTILRIRRSLSEEERELLILRIDRHLDWDDLALTTLGEHAASDAVAAESLRTRERMRDILERLEIVAVEQRVARPRGRP